MILFQWQGQSDAAELPPRVGETVRTRYMAPKRHEKSQRRRTLYTGRLPDVSMASASKSWAGRSGRVTVSGDMKGDLSEQGAWY